MRIQTFDQGLVFSGAGHRVFQQEQIWVWARLLSLVAITESSIPAARLFILFKFIRKMVRIWMVYIQAISVGAVVKKLF